MKLSSFLIPGILTSMTLAGLSCSKTGGGKPSLSIESINNPIQAGENLDVKLKFTNGSNLSGGTLVVFRHRVNQIPPINNISSSDTLPVILPTYSGVDKGELEFVQPYNGYLHYDDHINDTLIFRFAVIDASGHSSDTIASGKIVSLSP
jgi:hypothetical protein